MSQLVDEDRFERVRVSLLRHLDALDDLASQLGRIRRRARRIQAMNTVVLVAWGIAALVWLWTTPA